MKYIRDNDLKSLKREILKPNVTEISLTQQSSTIYTSSPLYHDIINMGLATHDVNYIDEDDVSHHKINSNMMIILL